MRRNDPYAGGYITRHYGRPREGVQALQIEVARDLYMDEGGSSDCPAFPASAYDYVLHRGLGLQLAPVPRPGLSRRAHRDGIQKNGDALWRRQV